MANRNEGAWILNKDIALKLGLPRHFLARVLRILKNERILESQRGQSGGFRLARPPKNVNLFEIIEPIDRLTRQKTCLLGHTYCTLETPCRLHNSWQRIMTDFVNLLKETTLAELSKILASGKCFKVPPKLNAENKSTE
jgi:Rrf2 family protein